MRVSRLVFVARVLATLLCVAVTSPVHAIDIRGNVSGQTRTFPEDALYPGQSKSGFSAAAEIEFYQAVGRSHGVTFTPFGRIDSEDDRRTHIDIRELYWEMVGDRFELRAGINSVFWGVTESLHLVDIINQTDLVENIDTEDKLGQPMLNLSLIIGAGTLDLFVMSGFRERTFPGAEGRLRFEVLVDENNITYESDQEEWQVDAAVRWSRVFGPVDLGVSHFYGTSRDPDFVFVIPTNAAPSIRQHYPLINQTGVDAQLTLGGWLWKFEAINRAGFGPERFAAVAGGFEYTFVGIAESALDLGVLAEYLWDERDQTASTPTQNDLFFGARLALNDVQSTAVLAGGIVDLDNGSTSFLVEAERRVGSSWSVSVEGRGFANIDTGDFFSTFRNDSFLQFDVTRFF